MRLVEVAEGGGEGAYLSFRGSMSKELVCEGVYLNSVCFYDRGCVGEG